MLAQGTYSNTQNHDQQCSNWKCDVTSCFYLYHINYSILHRKIYNTLSFFSVLVSLLASFSSYKLTSSLICVFSCFIFSLDVSRVFIKYQIHSKTSNLKDKPVTWESPHTQCTQILALIGFLLIKYSYHALTLQAFISSPEMQNENHRNLRTKPVILSHVLQHDLTVPIN